MLRRLNWPTNLANTLMFPSGKLRRLILGGLSLLVLGACGPTLKVSSQFRPDQVQKLAVIPPQYPATVSRERVNYILTALRSELAANKFSLLDQKVVEALCSSSECSERKVFAQRYGIQAFAEMKNLDSSRNNFVAGYYNNVSGDLVISDVDGKELVKVEHTESERGGLIFNSGQIIQGVISQLNNGADESFNNLANRFVKSLVAKVPHQLDSSAAKQQLVIDNVETKVIKPSVYEICATGSSNAIAAFLTNKRRTTLREVKPGMYCGNFLLNADLVASSRLLVELRSAYGESVQKEIAGGRLFFCDPRNAIRVENVQPYIQVGYGCEQLAQSDPMCQDRIGRCRETKFIVYQAVSESGPWLKFTETTRLPLRLEKKKLYRLLSVGSRGEISPSINISGSEGDA